MQFQKTKQNNSIFPTRLAICVKLLERQKRKKIWSELYVYIYIYKKKFIIQKKLQMAWMVLTYHFWWKKKIPEINCVPPCWRYNFIFYFLNSCTPWISSRFYHDPMEFSQIFAYPLEFIDILNRGEGVTDFVWKSQIGQNQQIRKFQIWNSTVQS